MTKKTKQLSVKLTVSDRLNIAFFLPEKSTLEKQIRAKAISSKTDLTSEELDKIGYKTVGDRAQWNLEKAEIKEIEFTKGEIDLLKSGVDEKDKSEDIPRFMVDLCMKIKGV